MAQQTDERMIWVDVETSGLDLDLDPVFEIGLLITDKWGAHIAETSFVIWEDNDLYADGLQRGRDDEYVNQMHTKSGLWADLEGHTFERWRAEELLISFLDENEVMRGALPMCGSSVQFDRLRIERHFPNLHEEFHYRNVDISTVKELCRRLNPTLYSKISQIWTRQELHRVLPDLRDSVSEYEFYYENFFFIED